MHLSQSEVTAIKQAATEIFGKRVAVWLFGSRVDDTLRGGDIDLLIKPPHIGKMNLFEAKIAFLNLLEKRLGERKVDVVIEQPGDSRPIVSIAHDTGIQL